MHDIESYSKPVVLIIEDHPMVAEVMRETLKTNGYATRLSADVRSAISMWQESPEFIHLILADVSALGRAGLTAFAPSADGQCLVSVGTNAQHYARLSPNRLGTFYMLDEEQVPVRWQKVQGSGIHEGDQQWLTKVRRS